jgi:hypothetical protein
MDLLKKYQVEYSANGRCLPRVWWIGPSPFGHSSKGSLAQTAWCCWSYLDNLKLNSWVWVENELGLHLGLQIGSPTQTCPSGNLDWRWPPLSKLNQRSRGAKTSQWANLAWLLRRLEKLAAPRSPWDYSRACSSHLPHRSRNQRWK